VEPYGCLWSSAGDLRDISDLLVGLLIAVPISFGAAIFLVELAPNWLKGPASFVIEMLAAIPVSSSVYGTLRAGAGRETPD